MKNCNVEAEKYILQKGCHLLTLQKEEWLHKHQKLKKIPTEAMCQCGILEIYDLSKVKKSPYFHGEYVAIYSEDRYIDYGDTWSGIEQECQDIINNLTK